MNLSNELKIATALAYEAGAQIMEFYGSDVVAEEKLGVDNLAEPVTIADKTASKTIVAGLLKAFPGDGILSEEEVDEPDQRLSKSRLWIIDPLDGTRGFINRNGDFGVQIGLVENGEVLLGVVYLPVEKILYYAVKGEGSYSRQGQDDPVKLHASEKSDFGEMVMSVSRDHRSPKMDGIAGILGLKGQVERGSVGLKIGLIATRVCDLYVHFSPRTKFWDTCAPQIILEEAGGKMTDLFGHPLRYDLHSVQNHNGVLATNGVVHDRVVTAIAPILNEFGRYRITNPK